LADDVQMSEAKRLKLIVEAVKYCKRMEQKGMPSCCYTKALREPIYFLWTRRAKGISKEKLATYCSKAAVGLLQGNGQLIFDHAIPFKLLQQELLELDDVTPEAVRKVLLRHEVIVFITKEEDKLLNESGLQADMPRSWNRKNPLARYRAVGIKLVRNQPAS
jgi:hypothetical protein